jgi:hypothetical protein
VLLLLTHVPPVTELNNEEVLPAHMLSDPPMTPAEVIALTDTRCVAISDPQDDDKV